MFNSIDLNILDRYESGIIRYAFLAHYHHPLMEAAYRPEDIYPHAWAHGPEMLLPQLGAVKRFTKITSLKSIYNTVRGNNEASFENAKLAFCLAEIGDSDCLISRLVQIAQLSISLDAIHAAQFYHAWTDEQWIEMQQILETFDMIALLPEAIRCERAIHFTWIDPLLTKPWSETFRQFQYWQTEEHIKQYERKSWILSLIDSSAPGFSQAFKVKQWNLCLEGYSLMIRDLQKASDQSKTTAWKNKNLAKQGYWGRGTLGSLWGIQNKFIRLQVMLELGKSSIALERFYLKHQTYPDKLEKLAPAFTGSILQDPITGNKLSYRKLGIGGFEIYSFGLNAKDNEGQFEEFGHFDDQAPLDDLLWTVQVSLKTIPDFSVEDQTKGLKKRYGIINH